jgi:hypothetical protein
MMNDTLIEYYKKHCGLVLDRNKQNAWKRYDYMVTSYEDIINHCDGSTNYKMSLLKTVAHLKSMRQIMLHSKRLKKTKRVWSDKMFI